MREPWFGVVEESGDGEPGFLTVYIANEAGLDNAQFQSLVRKHAQQEAPPGAAWKIRWHYRYGKLVRAEIVFNDAPHLHLTSQS